MKTLILVDIQNDFLPGGALAVREGDRVIPVANELMKTHDLVVATQDWHPRGHESFASSHAGKRVGEVIELHGLTQVLWPDHCVQGTRGAEIAATVDRSRIARVVTKGEDPAIDSYSGFFDNGKRKATALDAYLKSVGAKELTVVGLATDYCVRATVVDAIELGYPVTVVASGCRAVELKAGDGERALAEMKRAGARVE